MVIMSVMESMGTSSIPLIASFFIGLMMAFSPCPLATNITAIAYISRKMKQNIILTGLFYTLGRTLTYVCIAFLIVYLGVNIQSVSFFLQKYGEKILGPLLLIIGIVMLDLIKLNIKLLNENKYLDKIKLKLSEKGYLGSFLLGILFALAFCPFSAVLFFGMLIPLAIRINDAIFIPAIFSIGTGLPVIIFSIFLFYSIKKLSIIMKKVQTVELWTRKIVGIIFILVGLYYIFRVIL
jgi:cytochrome c-type biogenesis protein